MARVGYEVFLGGRLLKETELVYVGNPGAAADSGDPADYVPGQFRWMVDQQYIAEDVAQAMPEKGGERA